MLLVLLRAHHSVAGRLEDVIEKLAALFAVLHRVITLHCHEEGHQVWNSYRAIDCRVYTENEGINTEKLGQSRKYFPGLTQKHQVLFVLNSRACCKTIPKHLNCNAHRLLHSAGS